MIVPFHAKQHQLFTEKRMLFLQHSPSEHIIPDATFTAPQANVDGSQSSEVEKIHINEGQKLIASTTDMEAMLTSFTGEVQRKLQNLYGSDPSSSEHEHMMKLLKAATLELEEIASGARSAFANEQVDTQDEIEAIKKVFHDSARAFVQQIHKNIAQQKRETANRHHRIRQQLKEIRQNVVLLKKHYEKMGMGTYKKAFEHIDPRLFQEDINLELAESLLKPMMRSIRIEPHQTHVSLEEFSHFLGNKDVKELSGVQRKLIEISKAFSLFVARGNNGGLEASLSHQLGHLSPKVQKEVKHAILKDSNLLRGQFRGMLVRNIQQIFQEENAESWWEFWEWFDSAEGRIQDFLDPQTLIDTFVREKVLYHLSYIVAGKKPEEIVENLSVAESSSQEASEKQSEYLSSLDTLLVRKVISQETYDALKDIFKEETIDTPIESIRENRIVTVAQAANYVDRLLSPSREQKQYALQYLKIHSLIKENDNNEQTLATILAQKYEFSNSSGSLALTDNKTGEKVSDPDMVKTYLKSLGITFGSDGNIDFSDQKTKQTLQNVRDMHELKKELKDRVEAGKYSLEDLMDFLVAVMFFFQADMTGMRESMEKVYIRHIKKQFQEEKKWVDTSDGLTIPLKQGNSQTEPGKTYLQKIDGNTKQEKALRKTIAKESLSESDGYKGLSSTMENVSWKSENGATGIYIKKKVDEGAESKGKAGEAGVDSHEEERELKEEELERDPLEESSLDIREKEFTGIDAGKQKAAKKYLKDEYGITNVNTVRFRGGRIISIIASNTVPLHGGLGKLIPGETANLETIKAYSIKITSDSINLYAISNSGLENLTNISSKLSPIQNIKMEAVGFYEGSTIFTIPIGEYGTLDLSLSDSETAKISGIYGAILKDDALKVVGKGDGGGITIVAMGKTITNIARVNLSTNQYMRREGGDWENIADILDDAFESPRDSTFEEVFPEETASTDVFLNIKDAIFSGETSPSDAMDYLKRVYNMTNVLTCTLTSGGKIESITANKGEKLNGNIPQLGTDLGENISGNMNIHSMVLNSEGITVLQAVEGMELKNLSSFRPSLDGVSNVHVYRKHSEERFFLESETRKSLDFSEENDKMQKVRTFGNVQNVLIKGDGNVVQFGAEAGNELALPKNLFPNHFGTVKVQDVLYDNNLTGFYLSESPSITETYGDTNVTVSNIAVISVIHNSDGTSIGLHSGAGAGSSLSLAVGSSTLGGRITKYFSSFGTIYGTNITGYPGLEEVGNIVAIDIKNKKYEVAGDGTHHDFPEESVSSPSVPTTNIRETTFTDSDAEKNQTAAKAYLESKYGITNVDTVGFFENKGGMNPQSVGLITSFQAFGGNTLQGSLSSLVPGIGTDLHAIGVQKVQIKSHRTYLFAEEGFSFLHALNSKLSTLRNLNIQKIHIVDSDNMTFFLNTDAEEQSIVLGLSGGKTANITGITSALLTSTGCIVRSRGNQLQIQGGGVNISNVYAVNLTTKQYKEKQSGSWKDISAGEEHSPSSVSTTNIRETTFTDSDAEKNQTAAKAYLESKYGMNNIASVTLSSGGKIESIAAERGEALIGSIFELGSDLGENISSNMNIHFIQMDLVSTNRIIALRAPAGKNLENLSDFNTHLGGVENVYKYTSFSSEEYSLESGGGNLLQFSGDKNGFVQFSNVHKVGINGDGYITRLYPPKGDKLSPKSGSLPSAFSGANVSAIRYDYTSTPKYIDMYLASGLSVTENISGVNVHISDVLFVSFPQSGKRMYILLGYKKKEEEKNLLVWVNEHVLSGVKGYVFGEGSIYGTDITGYPGLEGITNITDINIKKKKYRVKNGSAWKRIPEGDTAVSPEPKVESIPIEGLSSLSVEVFSVDSFKRRDRESGNLQILSSEWEKIKKYGADTNWNIHKVSVGSSNGVLVTFDANNDVKCKKTKYEGKKVKEIPYTANDYMERFFGLKNEGGYMIQNFTNFTDVEGFSPPENINEIIKYIFSQPEVVNIIFDFFDENIHRNDFVEENWDALKTMFGNMAFEFPVEPDTFFTELFGRMKLVLGVGDDVELSYKNGVVTFATMKVTIPEDLRTGTHTVQEYYDGIMKENPKLGKRIENFIDKGVDGVVVEEVKETLLHFFGVKGDVEDTVPSRLLTFESLPGKDAKFFLNLLWPKKISFEKKSGESDADFAERQEKVTEIYENSVKAMKERLLLLITNEAFLTHLHKNVKNSERAKELLYKIFSEYARSSVS
jgi:hypothetical protein